MALKSLWELQMSLVQHGGAIIIDAGANEGQSIEQYRPRLLDSIVYCLEPDPRAFSILSAKWGEKPGVHLYPEALGAAEGRLPLNLGVKSYVSSLLPRKDDYDGILPAVDISTVNVITLDSFIEREKIPYISILKMDLQGFDLEALKGATRILKEEVVDVLLVEVWFEPAYQKVPLYWEVARYLADFPYRTIGVETATYSDNTEGRWGDLLLVSRRWAKELGI